jgi:hypothetical protein
MELYGPLWEDWLCEDVRQIVRNYLMPPPPPPTPTPFIGYALAVCCKCDLRKKYHWAPPPEMWYHCFCNYCDTCDSRMMETAEHPTKVECPSCQSPKSLPTWSHTMLPVFIKK